MAYYGPGTRDIYLKALTSEEEASLFKEYYAGSLAARDTLIGHYLLVTAKMALTITKGVLTEDDAISAGNMGLMIALEKRSYDPARGFRFVTYLHKFIKSQVCKAMRSKVGQNGSRYVYWSEENLGVDTTPAIKAKDIPSLDPSVEELDLARYRKFLVLKYLPTLSARQRDIVKRIVFDEETFETVGRALRISKAGVWGAYTRALKKLKQKVCIEYNEYEKYRA